MAETQRLFFGNPVKPQATRPFPSGGQRQCFGEKQLEKPNPTPLNQNSVVLAFGNQPQQIHPDTPFEVVNGIPLWKEKPKL